jgi:hypothetical protein
MTMALGNGAELAELPNFRRPLRKRISPCIAYLCHHFVSVRAGTRHTTIGLACAAPSAFAIPRSHCEFGGAVNIPCPSVLQQTTVVRLEITLALGVYSKPLSASMTTQDSSFFAESDVCFL